MYANALTDLSGWYNSTNGWTLTPNSKNAGILEIFDCKLYIEKYFLQVSEVPKIVQQLYGSVIEMPFSMLQQQAMPFPASQSMIDLHINASQFQNLERIMLTCRRKNDTNSDSLRDCYVLRNGSDADIGTNSSTTNYDNGVIGFAVDTNSALITNPATAPSGGLLWCSRQYNGIYRVQVKWLYEELV